jgi:serine/threonine protein phosphatase 1
MSFAPLQHLAGRLGLRPRRGAAADTGGRLVYAIGDVHGCYDLLKDLLAQIAEDVAARTPDRRPVLVFCGDYIDRGPQPAQVLEALIWLQRADRFELHLLMGNHEQALLGFLENPASAPGWLRNGGDATLAGYGVEAPDPEAGEAAFVRARDALLARLPAAHLRLLQSLRLMVAVGDYVFVHAGVRPGVALADQNPDDLLWIREAFTRAPGPFEKVVVHGHSWTSDRPQVLGHRIGIDTGAYATGALTAVRLDGPEVAVLQTGAPSGEAWDPWAMPPPPVGAPAGRKAASLR